MRYLSKQFETEICKSYRPFLPQEWEKERSSELFCVNYGKAEVPIGERGIRRITSLAAQLGKRRIVAEVARKDSKRIAGFYFANGVNLACFQEMQDEYTQEYFMRLGYFLGEGSRKVNVAILEPDDEDCRMFSKHGIEYHMLTNREMIKYGFVGRNKIGCGKCEYEFLVLPSGVLLEPIMVEITRRFFEQGGNILLLGEEPRYMGKECLEKLCLNSTCTFGKIKASQVYHNKNLDTEIYSTYCTMNEMKILYAVNASLKKEYEQTFDFGKQVHSFLKLDLQDLHTEQVSLTVKLRPGEDIFLIPYAKEIE